MPGVYLYQPDGRTAGYAVPVAGQGFWAPIRGVVGVKPDLKTLAGLAFYDQNETPGLGARIAERSFRGQFEGLRLGEPERLIGIRAPSVNLAEHEVHAISGATQTCVRLEKLINDSLNAWLAEWRGG
ncbi:MAG: FMN-binding protein, partial [Kiritimatiellia bacterium]